MDEAKKAQTEAIMAMAEDKYPMTLKSILTQYLRHVDPILKYLDRLEYPPVETPHLDHAILKVFDKKNTSFLWRNGWNVTDVVTWAWILTAESNERAALRMVRVAHEDPRRKHGASLIPHFVFVFLLRRQNTSARALQVLLIHAWNSLDSTESNTKHLNLQGQRPNDSPARDANTGIDTVRSSVVAGRGMREVVFMVMIIRLLRAALKVWPAACENIVALLNRYLDGLNFRKGAAASKTMKTEDTARLTYQYNTILKILALPSSLHPFQSATHQQRAQFNVLRRMNDFEPPLIVDRRGYRAVVSMQLMHKKTLKEREWAHMKAKSWPPWKEEKLGIDASVGVEDGISRAKEALNRAREAGYATDAWDTAVGILSGWDTDGSPTIQTRTTANVLPNLPKTLSPTKNLREDVAMWAARIRATRTLDEAWSCFMTYKDESLCRQSGYYAMSIYYAMWEKIVGNAKRLRREKSRPILLDFDQPLPGDGKEVSPTPVSPREAIYIRRPPPDMDEFYKLLIEDGVKPSGRFLASLLQNAPSFEKGLQFLETGALESQQIFALLEEVGHMTPETKAALESIPQYLFAAFIRHLTLFSPTLSGKHGYGRLELINTGQELELYKAKIAWSRPASLKIRSEMKEPNGVQTPSGVVVCNPLSRAIHLVLARKPRYRPTWYHVIRALANPRTVTDIYVRFVDQEYQDIKTWQMTCRLLNEMLEIDLSVDLDGFQILCCGLEKAIFASEKLARSPPLHSSGDGGTNTDIKRYVNHVLSAGLPLLKEIFKDIVNPRTMQEDIPASISHEDAEVDRALRNAQVSTEDDALRNDDNRGDLEQQSRMECKSFLSPGCLLPKLLEVPHPAQLHALIRILGLRRDYEGLLDLIEWMALFSDEVLAVASETMNGRSMMRRCMTATRVFLERSWMDISPSDDGGPAGHSGIVIEADPAPVEILSVVYDTIMEKTSWGGWPTDEEVLQYCSHGRFL